MRRPLSPLLILVPFLLLGCQAVNTPGTGSVTPASADWTLDWSDEFNGTALDTAVWNYDLGAGGWGNNESEFYQQANAVVAGGALTITAKVEAVGDAPYTSARIQTAQKKTFTYGRFEMRAKLPQTQGMWPAFWLLGADCDTFGGLYLPPGTTGTSWPGSGEIDIMEMIGGLADGSGDYTTHGTLHYWNSMNKNPAPSYFWRNPAKLSADFHTYAVDWTPQGFTWSIDGVAFASRTITADMEEFHKPFFLLLNLAVGGNWGGWTNGSTVFPQNYVIDYVRHYSKTYPPAGTAPALPGTWHLTNKHTLDQAAGTISGSQPQFLLKFDTEPQSWTSGSLNGTYDAGAWTAAFVTTPVSQPVKLQARIYRQGTGPEVLLATAVADMDTANGTNHATALTFTGMPAVTLTGETLRLELTKVSGPMITLMANGLDFDSNLSMPWSGAGTAGAPPAGVPWVDPVVVSNAPETLGVYSDTPLLAAWTGLAAPGGYGPSAGGPAITADSDAAHAYEGSNSLAIHLTGDGQGFSWASSNNDLSAYTKLHFWMKTSSSAALVRIRMAASGPLGTCALTGRFDPAVTGWQEVVIPLTSMGGLGGGDWAGINTPFGLEAVGGVPNFSAQIDKVYFSRN